MQAGAREAEGKWTSGGQQDSLAGQPEPGLCTFRPGQRAGPQEATVTTSHRPECGVVLGQQLPRHHPTSALWSLLHANKKAVARTVTGTTSPKAQRRRIQSHGCPTPRSSPVQTRSTAAKTGTVTPLKHRVPPLRVPQASWCPQCQLTAWQTPTEGARSPLTELANECNTFSIGIKGFQRIMASWPLGE